jgi:Ran GTPase-activating protein (RanGAP) involved in mRNA processing and transport
MLKHLSQKRKGKEKIRMETIIINNNRVSKINIIQKKI